jgi:hypothetical protein
MTAVQSGIAIATAAAALFTAGLLASPTVQAADGGVHCVGINSCKGSSECKTAKNECKGQNSCKGQGWTSTKTAKDCTDAGGKVAK